jgi:hypothetical protein
MEEEEYECKSERGGRREEEESQQGGEREQVEDWRKEGWI